MNKEDCNESVHDKLYTYQCSFPTNSVSWSMRQDKPFRFAVSSFLNEYANHIEMLSLNEDKSVLQRDCVFDHPYPATKVMFLPNASTNQADLFATTGDYLRLWEIDEAGECKMKTLLNTNKKSDFCAPLTSFDWNSEDYRYMVTASVDTTCAIWDITTQQITTQLIAHDKEVYDVAFAKGQDHFASVGADGSLRMFDLRALDHSTILYESQNFTPLLRLSWNKLDPNYIATIMVDSPTVVVLDLRIPSVPIAVLNNHQSAVNSLEWAPHSSCHICTAGDDSQALIWDLSSVPAPVEDPILAYNSGTPINAIRWSAKHSDWIAISFADKVQMLRV
jgi:WD repeat-containing protein 68